LATRFDVISFASGSGDFERVTEPLIATDRHFAVVVSSSGAALIVEPVASHVVTWDAGGDRHTWQDAPNWSGNRLPGLGDRVEITRSEPQIDLTEDATVGALVVGGPGSIGLQVVVLGRRALLERPLALRELEIDAAFGVGERGFHFF